MHRIDTPGNQAGMFVPPNVLTGQQPVKVDSPWLNDVQETLANPIEASGAVLQKGVFNQLTTAINTLVGNAIAALKAATNTWQLLQTFNAGLTVTAGATTLAADPTLAMQAATKQYVDSVAQGIVAKPAVQAATTANITLSGAQTIDGVAVVAGNRVLVKNQTTAAQNGIYVVASGAWSLAADFNAWAEVPGAFVFVEGGTANAHSSWVCSAPASGTLGTTAISFNQFAYAGAYSADGTTLSLTGPVFSIANGGVGTNQLAGAAVTAAKLGAGAAAANLGYTPLNPASNLADLGNQGTARNNLGLGPLATLANLAQLLSFLGAVFSIGTGVNNGGAVKIPIQGGDLCINWGVFLNAGASSDTGTHNFVYPFQNVPGSYGLATSTGALVKSSSINGVQLHNTLSGVNDLWWIAVGIG